MQRDRVRHRRAHGRGLRILTGRLAGTYTPTGEGKFFFTMMAAFGELERDMLQERTFAGLAAAREQGRVGGRPTVMSPDKLAAARARRANGETPTQIAKALGISRTSVYRTSTPNNTVEPTAQTTNSCRNSGHLSAG